MIQADNAILAEAGDSTVIVPGHVRSGIVRSSSSSGICWWRFARSSPTLEKQGKSLPEVVAVKPTAAYDAKYGNFVIGPDLFTKIVYDGLK